MPISSSWRIDSDRRPAVCPRFAARPHRLWQPSPAVRTERRRSTPWARRLRGSPITAVAEHPLEEIELSAVSATDTSPGRGRRHGRLWRCDPRRGRGQLPSEPSGRTPRQHRNASIHQACRFSGDQLPAANGLGGRRAARAALQSPRPRPLAPEQEEAGEEVQPGHAGAGGTLVAAWGAGAYSSQRAAKPVDVAVLHRSLKRDGEHDAVARRVGRLFSVDRRLSRGSRSGQHANP
jgi:hypothetical protein